MSSQNNSSFGLHTSISAIVAALRLTGGSKWHDLIAHIRRASVAAHKGSTRYTLSILHCCFAVPGYAYSLVIWVHTSDYSAPVHG
jgi:hypothetical protein